MTIPRPEPIGAAVLGELEDGRCRFVFPSEVAARSWLERILVATGRAALPGRRFVSWDAFKSARFPGPEGARPCSKLVRGLFARSLMADNAKAPFLRSVVPPDRADASPRFARTVASALPALRRLPEGSGEGLADWRLIRERYAAFLAERGLYEASWNPRAAAPGAERWILFYPDLTEDWADYEDAVRAMPDAKVIDASTLSPEPVPSTSFVTLVDEIRAVLLKIRESIEGGVDPCDIAITVAAPDSALPVLQREAAVAGIPLDARDAYALADSAGGRLMADLVDVARSGRSFEALRRLLLDLSRPWNDPEAARALVGLGIRKHVLAPLPDLGRDIWEASMDASVGEGPRALYRGIRAASDAIAAAPGFGALRSAFDSFRRSWLDEGGWDPAQDDELARCVAELDALEDAAELAGLPSSGGAAEAYLEHLSEVRYLPVSSTGGVAVYRFPVAAGASPLLHFSVNLAEGSAASAARPLSFLRDDERERCGATDRDLSPGLIRLLGVSGERTWASWSEDGPDGVRPAHPALGQMQPGGARLIYERSAWLMNRDEGDRVGGVDEAYPLQKAGAMAASVTALPGDGRAFTEGRPDRPVRMSPGLSSAVLASQSDGDGLVKLSETLLSTYGSCAFRWLFESVFGVEESDTGLSFVDARMLGGIYHDALARALAKLRNAGLSVVAGLEAGETDRPSPSDALSALDAAIGDASAREGPFAGALLRSALPALRGNLIKLLGALRQLADGMRPVLVEDYLSATVAGLEGARLVGKADAVFSARAASPGALSPQGGAPALIVDYKKKSVPRKSELSPDEDGAIARFQMPMYALLVESAGYEAVSGWYLPVEGDKDGKRRPVQAFGPDERSAVGPEGMAAMRAALESACAWVLDGLRAGNVFVPAKRDQETVCALCGSRPVCRERYAVP